MSIPPIPPIAHGLQARRWRNPTIIGIGEAMLEFAAVGDDLYRRGFAGDTLNTCWHMAQILGRHAHVGYATNVGDDAFSDQLVAFIAASGIGVDRIVRDTERTLGLYVIGLAGAERHFSYWRDTSAARRLADDLPRLVEATRQAGLIHVSGITLAVIGAAGRRNLLAALRSARADGAVVSFDPNLRPRLWPDGEELRAAMQAMLEVTQIALPSFDDEARLWHDADPEATAARIAQAGVEEIVVKDGAGDVVLSLGGAVRRIATPPVALVRDTTGAGDSFNAGYLAGRLVGMDAPAASRLAQGVAGEVIGHFGALPPKEALLAFRQAIDAQARARTKGA